MKPLGIRTAQPIIDNRTVRLQLGLDAETKVVTGKADLQCKFPESLIIDPPQPGRLTLVLPAHASYEWLSKLLNNSVKGDVEVRDVHLRIKGVGLRPHGSSLLLEINLAVRTGNWFGKRAEGTVYIVAKPVLDANAQTIVMSDLALDTESRDALVSILGEVVEPVLLDLLNDNSTIDLDPKIQEVRNKSEKMFEVISGGGFDVEGQVDSIELERIDVGRDNLRIVSKMVASIRGTVRNIQVGR